MRETLAQTWKALKRKPLSLAGLGLLGFFGFVAAAAPVLAPPAEKTALLERTPLGREYLALTRRTPRDLVLSSSRARPCARCSGARRAR